MSLSSPSRARSNPFATDQSAVQPEARRNWGDAIGTSFVSFNPALVRRDVLSFRRAACDPVPSAVALTLLNPAADADERPHRPTSSQGPTP